VSSFSSQKTVIAADSAEKPIRRMNDVEAVNLESFASEEIMSGGNN